MRWLAARHGHSWMAAASWRTNGVIQTTRTRTGASLGRYPATGRRTSAGLRFRRAYESGVLGLEGSALGRLGKIRSSSPDAGPSESRVKHLERYEAARASLGRLYDIASGIIEHDLSVKEYCGRFGLPASATLGRLIAALDVLRDHYDLIDNRVRARGEPGDG